MVLNFVLYSLIQIYNWDEPAKIISNIYFTPYLQSKPK